MDDIDHLYERDERLHELLLQQRKTVEVSVNGMCLWCKEYPISGVSKGFCSRECGDDYARWEWRKR